MATRKKTARKKRRRVDPFQRKVRKARSKTLGVARRTRRKAVRRVHRVVTLNGSVKW